ncbi:MAG TPA: mechanosensitive ion channel domain-containing protein [Bacteroidales bacterium]|nr:mechanosensitive ion channel domain-containing protein [Bacteroidales bacterium]
MNLSVNTRLRFLFDLQELLQGWGFSQSQANAINIVFGILNILILAWLADIVTKRIIIVVISRMVAKTKTVWDDILLEKNVLNKLAHLAPALVLWFSVGHVLFQYKVIMGLTQKALSIYMIVITIMAINAFLKGVNEIYRTLPAAQGKSIKGFTQIVQIVAYFIAAISIISILTNTPSHKLITGLGAAAAVLMLVFKDTILGFVASVQLSANDMLRIGDWITMQKYGADGNVIEVTLNTVKVRNFDKTITTIPTYTMVSDSFINWRGTEEESARRFKKYLNIDMKTVTFCTPGLLARVGGIKTLGEFLEHQDKKKKQENVSLLHESELTNITLFRKYIVGILRNHPQLNHKLPMLVRQLQPTELGIPLEIIAFVKGTEALVYEEVQSDLFDHLLAILPEFELEVFQNPSTNVRTLEKIRPVSEMRN